MPTTDVDTTRDVLRDYLARVDEPCPRCGYNLRMIEGAACPECGSGLRLKVGLIEPRLGAYVTTLAMCSIGFGGSGLFLLLVLVYAPAEWWTKSVAGWLLIGQFVITGTALPILLFGRRLLTRRSYPMQWIIALLMGAFVVLCSAGIVLAFED